MRKLMFLLLLSSCDQERVVTIERVEYISKDCDKRGYCTVGTDKNRFGLMYKPEEGMRVCGYLPSRGTEYTALVQGCQSDNVTPK